MFLWVMMALHKKEKDIGNINKQKNKKREEIKVKHACGEGYISLTGKEVSAKIYSLVSECLKVSVSVLKKLPYNNQT